MHSINPSHVREVVGKCAKADVKLANDAIDAAYGAYKAFQKLCDVDPNERANYLVKAATIMRRRRYEMSAWQVYECAKNWREADADVCEAIDFLEYYAAEMRRLAQPAGRNLPGEDRSEENT